MEIGRWEGFRRALRGRDVEAFDDMMNACRVHASAGGMAVRPFVTEAVFMSILLEQQRELMELKENLSLLERVKNWPNKICHNQCTAQRYA
jgi:hypothetical protein